MYKKYRLSKVEFRNWLKSLDPDAIVGRKAASALCPIALYIRQDREQDSYVPEIDETVMVLHRSKRIDKEIVHKTPNWAKEFINRIDKLKCTPRHNSLITVKEALTVLEKV